MIHFPHPPWDIAVVLFFNKFCGKCVFLDTLALVFLTIDALRTAILVACVMGIWEYANIKGDLNSRKRVIAILFSIVVSIGIIEILNSIIDSPRPAVTYEHLINTPIIKPDTKLLWQYGWIRNSKHGSFPSDTVSLISVIAVGLFMWNRIIGVFAILFVILAGILPRLYFGLHYPSDMLIGFFISIFSCWLIEKLKFFDYLAKQILVFHERLPYIFGTFGFYLAYIIADKFLLLRKLPLWIKVMMGH